MAQQALDQPVYTYRDYLTWPEDDRCELIDGRIFSMAPAPNLEHQTVVIELTPKLPSSCAVNRVASSALLWMSDCQKKQSQPA